MSEVKGAIFDLDGTLLDSMGIWAQIDRRFLEKRGIPLPDDYVEKVTPMNYHDAAVYTIQRFTLAETEEEIIRDWVDLSVQAYHDEILLKPHVANYLNQLKQQGIKLAVATAQTRELYEPALRRNQIYHLFDAFADLSEVNRGKGFPDIYLLAAKRISLSAPDCMVFEDICAGIRGAKAGGFQTCGIYDPYSEYEKEKIQMEADRYVTTFRELLDTNN